MKDTKGVRQVLEQLAWAGRYTDAGQAVVSETELNKAEAALQEIMLGMLPENPYKPTTKKNPQKTETQQILAVAEHAFETAVKLIEQNIRGGFNNG
jgi:hypothetical protein